MSVATKMILLSPRIAYNSCIRIVNRRNEVGRDSSQYTNILVWMYPAGDCHTSYKFAAMFVMESMFPLFHVRHMKRMLQEIVLRLPRHKCSSGPCPWNARGGRKTNLTSFGKYEPRKTLQHRLTLSK